MKKSVWQTAFTVAAVAGLVAGAQPAMANEHGHKCKEGDKECAAKHAAKTGAAKADGTDNGCKAGQCKAGSCKNAPKKAEEKK